jgi:hypothetical protein
MLKLDHFGPVLSLTNGNGHAKQLMGFQVDTVGFLY